jgi:hypothetical protein
MMILELAITAALLVGESYLPTQTTCGPDQDCYPIDPNPPKPLPPNCFFDGEGVVCYPIDSGK